MGRNGGTSACHPPRVTGAIDVRPIRAADRPWVERAVRAEWGSDRSVSRGRLTERSSALPGFLAQRGAERLGVVLLREDGDELEVVILLALVRRAGVGSALLRAAEEEAVRQHSRRLWLITTNDNLDAIRFYQRRGWDLVALHRDALAESRRLKPEIPETGQFGIPIRHELEFEAPLRAG
jgi:GNAT superfamily N-acetyltransferase